MKVLLFIISCILLSSCSGPKPKDSQKQPLFAGATDMIEKPTYLYKIVSMDDWAKSCRVVHLSNMDIDFIHLATEEQLDNIIEKYWADVSEYIVLKVETSKLSGNLVLETNPGGTNKYYHLYDGDIPLTAIVELKVYKT